MTAISYRTVDVDGYEIFYRKVGERIRSSIVSGRSAPGTLFSVPTLAGELNTAGEFQQRFTHRRGRRHGRENPSRRW